MRINIRKTLQFFDNPPKYKTGHASSMVALFGEELAAASFKHYFENKKHQRVAVLDDRVGGGKKKGKRLDRWILVGNKKKVLFQCEIKSWSSTAIGGNRLPVEASNAVYNKISSKNWKRQVEVVFNETDKFPNHTTKVFLQMKGPKGLDKYHPEALLIYWMPITIKNTKGPYFRVTVKSLSNRFIRSKFRWLHVFSVSSYFRQLSKKGIKVINLDLPLTQERLGILGELVSFN